MKNNRIFKVVVALTTQTYAGQRKLAGIFRFLSDKYLWDMTLLRSSQDFTVDFISRTKQMTDGYIVSIHISAEIQDALARTNKPIIFIDAITANSLHQYNAASFLRTNQKAIGAAAASYFLGQAHFATFAFVHAIGKPYWSLDRAEGFMSALARRKTPVAVYESDENSSDTTDLTNWIKTIPKPAAIFAAFDDRAVDIINACRTGGITIPKNVMIVGAGDDALICNGCRPTLSSVRVSFEEHGFMAARELQAMMMMKTKKHRILDISEEFFVIQRQTTANKIATPAFVHDGLAFIQAFATSGITVQDVIKHLKVSRRLADLRFRQSTGNSILQLIIEAKVAESKTLLHTTSLPISEIARRCGFSSANYFKNVFVRTVGESPRRWRNSHPIQKRRLPNCPGGQATSAE